jgi:hypothetical protein
LWDEEIAESVAPWLMVVPEEDRLQRTIYLHIEQSPHQAYTHPLRLEEDLIVKTSQEEGDNEYIINH